MEILLRYAQYSLKSLTLVGGEVRASSKCQASEHLYIGSLRAFEALSSVQIDLAMFIDDPRDVLAVNKIAAEGNEDSPSETEEEEILPSWYLEVSNQRQVVHRLVNVLPTSTEHLVLEMLANKKVLLQMLRRLPERKISRLPNLKEIVYECEERCVTGMEQACGKVGVKLLQRLKYGKYKNQPSDSNEDEDLETDYAASPSEWEWD